MSTRYVVRDGDCISSIAFAHGIFPGTLWDDPANAELRQKRRENPNALVAGDVVVIPDLKQTSTMIATGARHRFQRRGVPAKFRVQVRDDDEPVANAAFTLKIDGKVIEGTTTGEGIVETTIPPDAVTAYLRVTLPKSSEGEDEGDEGEEDDNVLEYSFRLGRLDPSDTPRGARQRLENLGLLPPGGGTASAIDPRTAAAIIAFQIQSGLRPTGELDPATVSKLAEIHDHE